MEWVKRAIGRALRRRQRRLPPLEEDPLWEMVGASDAEPIDDIDEYLVESIVQTKSKPT
jgi:hypothetical protein